MLIEFSFGKKDHNFDLLTCHLAHFSQFLVIIREIPLVLLRERPPGLQNMSHVSFFDGGKNRFIAIYYPHNKNVWRHLHSNTAFFAACLEEAY